MPQAPHPARSHQAGGAREPPMPTPKYAAQISNVYFLTHIGESLRWATSDIAREELPDEVVLLLRRLDRLEKRQKAVRQTPDNDPAA